MTRAVFQPRSINNLIPFLKDLRALSVKFSLKSSRDDAVAVCFTLVGCRVEVDLFKDHVEFSSFAGDEGVHDDGGLMQSLFDNHWSDD
jgi:hypothetical protein